ncbi:N-terminal C2 in EEIG1 and EHBP1 proteins-domain-containing protein [Durotheca rogersii]|uniref:N-terminal C2 in EEIG1 and EHBP1 proteins-domain-containing protein n=1 Tax=Durotheca rogersii TaxID=419775 RepID=UPI00221F8F58|nr:N-terminal C2 in EEIG1 and EHBP1 proteins-domain-containing protein [Durotheca rogersii]KAI5867665.1 N-terminal C2 in EEIG1 and EHBP1 proteins-domain-containing protein [Durotheca rogersii]
MASLINKARKPKFELHLTIYDLNNVPLVAGTSTVKWYLPSSMHGEHRGRTAKCSIDKIHHRVVYNYSKVIPLRISIDRNDNLTECPIEFEVLQEFPMVPGGRDEKIPLGTVRLNLSEYVEESENFPRRSIGVRASMNLDYPREKPVSQSMTHRRQSSSKSGADSSIVEASPTNTAAAPSHPEENDVVEDDAEEGIVRRYLMQESKINSTLKVGILMVQIDGERNFVAPPLKTAPMFGGIAGIMKGEQVEPEDGGAGSSRNLPNFNKSRDASELQDMYRRALTASWACQPGEMPADACIEDIFSGGDGWNDNTRPGGTAAAAAAAAARGSRRSHAGSISSHSNSGSAMSGDEANSGTLRPGDVRRIHRHMRTRSGGSDKTSMTTAGGGSSSTSSSLGRHGGSNSNRHDPSQSGHRGPRQPPPLPPWSHKEDSSGHDSNEGLGAGTQRSRAGSIASLATTLGSDRGREGFRRPREVSEYEEREDLVAWTLPEAV